MADGKPGEEIHIDTGWMILSTPSNYWSVDHVTLGAKLRVSFRPLFSPNHWMLRASIPVSYPMIPIW